MLPSLQQIIKKNSLILLLCSIQLIYILPLFHTGIPKTHDGENQIARFGSYILAFNDLNIPPRWAGNLNYTFGIPVLNFFYPLPGYIASVIHITGLSLENIFKLMSGIIFTISPIGIFLFLSLFAPKKSSFVGGLIYGLAPYQFLNLYVRGDIGESLSLCLFPFSLYFFARGIKEYNEKLVALGGLFAALALLAHHGVGLMMSPFLFIIICIISYKNNKKLLYISTFIFLWFGISAFFWIPAFFEQKYTLSSLFIGSMYRDNFLSFPNIIFSKWGFGPDTNLPGGQSPQIGILPFILFCIVLLSSYRKKISLLSITCIVFFLLSLFLMVASSVKVWNGVHILQKYQFPWRFLSLSIVTLSLTVGLLVEIKRKFIIIALSALLILVSFTYISTAGYIHHDDSWYIHFASTTFFHGETLTIWSDGEAKNYPTNPAEFIHGKGILTNINKKTQEFSANVTSETESTLRVNTTYYPGWKAYVDNKEVPIQFQDPNNRGVITFVIPEGLHNIQVKFTETKLRLFSDIVSLAAIIILFIILVSKPITNTIRHQ